MKKNNWLEIAKSLWSDKWEAIAGMVGLLISAATGLPPWAAAISLLLALILALDVAFAARKTARLAQEKHMPLVASVNRNRDKVRATVSEVLEVVTDLGFEPQRFLQQFDVEQGDWVLHQEGALKPEPGDWIELCRRFLRRVQRLERLKGRKTLHVFLDCPAALAMGLGASLGTRYQLVVYHRQPPYTAVMNVADPVYFKRRLSSPPQHITVHQPQHWTPEVFVALQLSAYAPEPYLKEMADAQGAALVAIRNCYDNVLPLDADWLQVAHEVAGAVTTICNQPGVRRVHLAFSCPVPLAFAIGMALGIQPAVRVYNWYADQKAYAAVLDLNRLRDLGTGAADLPALDVNLQAAAPEQARLAPLRRALVAHFDLEELRTLCFDLGVDYDALPGQGKVNKARDLLLHLDRRARIPDLVSLANRLRPHLDWRELVPPGEK